MAGNTIAISTISLAEIIYLIEKKRLEPPIYERLRQALLDSDYVIGVAPLTHEIVEVMRKVSREEVRDLPDRIVAATALHFGVPGISRDAQIRGSNLECVW